MTWPVTKGEIGPDVRYSVDLEARYSNYFQIGHNSSEVLVDCGCFYENDSAARIHTRIATTPAYAKALLKTLGGAIRSYEAAFGTINGSDPDDASED